MKLERDKSYTGEELLDYTRYSGPGVFIREFDDDFGTDEQHYVFRLPDGNECVFPKSSILAPVVEID